MYVACISMQLFSKNLYKNRASWRQDKKQKKKALNEIDSPLRI